MHKRTAKNDSLYFFLIQRGDHTIVEADATPPSV